MGPLPLPATAERAAPSKSKKTAHANAAVPPAKGNAAHDGAFSDEEDATVVLAAPPPSSVASGAAPPTKKRR